MRHVDVGPVLPALLGRFGYLGISVCLEEEEGGGGVRERHRMLHRNGFLLLDVG